MLEPPFATIPGTPRSLLAMARVEDVLGPDEGPRDPRLQRGVALLSGRERVRLRALRHRRRRREWLAARLLVKYLGWAEGGALPAARRSALQRVGRESIGLFLERTVRSRATRARCRQLELLASPSERSGRPHLTWRARALAWPSVSIAHAGGWVAVALGEAAAIGVDVETVEARHPSFRRRFTPAELGWCGHQRGLSEEVSLTLLWALREAAYKTGCFGSGAEGPEVIPEGDAPPLTSLPEGSAWSLAVLPVRLPDGIRAGALVLVTPGLVLVFVGGGRAATPFFLGHAE